MCWNNVYFLFYRIIITTFVYFPLQSNLSWLQHNFRVCLLVRQRRHEKLRQELLVTGQLHSPWCLWRPEVSTWGNTDVLIGARSGE